ncbi:hypothetical protein HBE96_13980 [Clostridium sp. P21]|uniref:Transposase IS801/IS1294 domain-containing protein n=1 Tax=Clostridium muellerianum TaxID=2716538 RepID=A0A7Y0EHV4_9CLOT|nr:hypothetical protein [Clostridium muellerianum]
MSHWYKKNKKCDYGVGVIAVIHTFGRDLKWNTHVHALVTEGTVDKSLFIKLNFNIGCI